MSDVSPYVPRPADLEGAALRELAEGYRLHAGALVNARYGIGRREPVGRLRSTALDALAVAAAIVEQLAHERWVNVADALSYGAPVIDVAAAMGLEPVEVAAGLRSWADGQHEHAGMSAAERDGLYALVAGYLPPGEVAALGAAADRRLGADDETDPS
jgi:hypothetical protein